MAGVSTKEIKTRIRSMESTKQITKAMEMVAASKLRHAQARIANSRPYFEILYRTIWPAVTTATFLSWSLPKWTAKTPQFSPSAKKLWITSAAIKSVC